MNSLTFKLIPLVAAMSVSCSKGRPDAERPSADDSSASDNPSATSPDDSPASGGPVEDVQTGDDLPTLAEPGTPSRPKVTAEECAAQGGQVIGDIGDGAVYQEAYMCPSGRLPIGNLVNNGDGPTAVEGAVCCP